ncbi:hypothetical protein [Tateyamaria omphalii]|uniref:Uncharacterized protein n=1 Tax=Tateyamaria omphalii TaxID=299262 RepID=A0A1P8N1T5_9RHOB|nr:hypothetical protein [Tateyamaria omphalii]APX14208.1 hypothetical protein BWR18_20330 [Tateyamaria omphalii]
MDEDLENMDRATLIAEVKRLRDAIRTHRDSSGHDLCWYHPELWGALPETDSSQIAIPPWDTFLRGCIAYRRSLDAHAPDGPVHTAEYDKDSI